MASETPVWVIRSGPTGSSVIDDFEANSLVAISFLNFGVGTVVGLRADELKATITAHRTDMTPGAISGAASRLIRFAVDVAVGDIVISPGADRVLVGRIAGDYEYSEQAPIDTYNHIRSVDWERSDARDQLPAGIRSGFRSRITIYQPAKPSSAHGSITRSKETH